MYASDVINLDCDIDMKGETALFNASFSGVFNGNGHSIHNVKIQTGLFRSINRDAEVKNLHISNVESDETSGVVTAENNGTISYCVVTGNLTASDSVDKLAGIAGMNMGTIENCVFSGEITSNDSYSGNVGAIVGLNSSGTIRNCYGIGKIAVSMGNAGGIAGRNDNVIENCANYMEVSSKAQSGGISGENAGTVSGCDNYGAVTCRQNGTGQTGGIVAKNTASGKIESCYNHGSEQLGKQCRRNRRYHGRNHQQVRKLCRNYRHCKHRRNCRTEYRHEKHGRQCKKCDNRML